MINFNHLKLVWWAFIYIQIIHNNAVKSRFYDPKYAVTNFTHKLITVNLIWRNRGNRILNSVLRTGPFNTSSRLLVPAPFKKAWLLRAVFRGFYRLWIPAPGSYFNKFILPASAPSKKARISDPGSLLLPSNTDFQIF